MSQSWWRKFMDRVRSNPWWPIHYRTASGTWWSWRGRHWRVQLEKKESRHG